MHRGQKRLDTSLVDIQGIPMSAQSCHHSLVEDTLDVNGYAESRRKARHFAVLRTVET